MKANISLFIHDSFFDSFSELPKAIQKKTREFMRKFQEDPTSSAINYEKISTFADQSLRTVRIDQKYRAIVQAPQEGNHYHLLWVDNHDEAMDWARRKVFGWNRNTHSFQHYNLPDEPITLPAAPVAAPPLFAELSAEHFEQIGTPASMVEILQRITAIEELDRLKPNLPADNYEYLYYLAQGIPLAEVLEEINEGKNAEQEFLADNARKHVFVLTDDKDLEEILSGNFEKWKLFLHPTQRKLAYGDFNGPVKVTGGAGTGKTVCAMHRAIHLLKQADVFEQRPILFTTYTKSLTSYLNETVKGFELSEEEEKMIEITNIDKLIHDLASSETYRIIEGSFGYLNKTEQEESLWREVLEQHPSTFDEVFLREEYNEVVVQNGVTTLEQYLHAPRTGRTVRIGRRDKIEIWQLIERYTQHKANNYSKMELCARIVAYFSHSSIPKPYSHIICDEVQDFTNMDLKVLRVLTGEKKNDLFLVGDPYQNIYQRQVNFARSGINIRGKRSRKLRVNYRTTEEIKQQALKIIHGLRFEDFNGEEENHRGYLSLMHGEEPVYSLFDRPEQQDEFIIDTIRQLLRADVNPGNICICARTNYAADELNSLLNRSGIEYVDISRAATRPHAVRVSSLHNIKGHEFKFVIVTGVSKDFVPYRHVKYSLFSEKQREAYHKEERALYYVAFSRAIQGLYITGVGEKCEWL